VCYTAKWLKPSSRHSGEAFSTVPHPPKLEHIGQTVNLLARVASAATAMSKMRIVSISAKVCGSFLSSVEDPQLSLDEPFKPKEKLSNLARSEYATHPSDFALIPRVDNDLAPVAAFLQVAVGIGRSL
jgi:hypothetical protein